MALITENGWSQCGSRDIVKPFVPGTSNVRPEVRGGVAATILIAWCSWWHQNVRPIDVYKPRDYWGWSATNEVWNSNHLSGTAVDLCATELPWKREVMPQWQIDAVQRGLALFDYTIFWGGNWARGNKDQMHSQLAFAEGDHRNGAFAAKLDAGYLGIYGPAPSPVPDTHAIWDDIFNQLTGGVK